MNVFALKKAVLSDVCKSSLKTLTGATSPAWRPIIVSLFGEPLEYHLTVAKYQWNNISYITPGRWIHNVPKLVQWNLETVDADKFYAAMSSSLKTGKSTTIAKPALHLLSARSGGTSNNRPFIVFVTKEDGISSVGTNPANYMGAA